MMNILRTASHCEGFIQLVRLLDKDLANRNGECNAFFAQYNHIQLLSNVVIVTLDDQPVACGAIKHFDDQSMEVKRMYTREENRGKGLAQMVLNELESWSRELGYEKLVLETGDKMPEAIRLYRKCGYTVIPNFGPYEDVESSICFEKKLK